MKKVFIRLCCVFAALALSAAAVFTALRRINGSVYASVYFVTSCGVRIDVNSKNVAVAVEGTNDSGRALAEGLSLEGRELVSVLEALIDRSLADGSLSDGGRLTITFDAEDDQWLEETKSELSLYLGEHLEERSNVTLVIDRRYSTSPPTTPPLPPYPTSAAPAATVPAGK